MGFDKDFSAVSYIAFDPERVGEDVECFNVDGSCYGNDSGDNVINNSYYDDSDNENDSDNDEDCVTCDVLTRFIDPRIQYMHE